MTQTLLRALSKYRRRFLRSHLRDLPQCSWFPFRQVVVLLPVAASPLRKMICMRRGLRANPSRQTQTRENCSSYYVESFTERKEAVSSTTNSSSGPMICSTEATSPSAKRVRLEESMPEKVKQDEVLRFVKISENATAPKRGSDHAAGFDLYSAVDCEVPAQGVHTVMTDIKIEVPEGCYGRVAPRSGLARKNFIDVGAGVIDRDYRGNVGVVMFNHGKTDFKVTKGERIAQLICEKICYPDLEEVQELSDTVRGSGGFGSTGKC